MADYLVTGAAGFIATRVIEMLLAQGHYVHGIDNLNNAYDVRMKEYRLKALQSNPNFHFRKVDIADPQLVDELCKTLPPISAVINLAARAGVRSSVEDPWLYMNTNATGTLNLLEFCRRTAVPKFVLASTSSLYGNNHTPPYQETLDTDHPLQPYAASKKAAEVMSYVYHYLHGIDVTVFRYFTVYGPAGRPDMVMFRFCKWIAEGEPVKMNGNGEQSRGFTYVDDIARGTILGLKPLGYEIINLGGHEVISMNQLVKMLEDRIGRKANMVYGDLHPADVLTNCADVSKAGSLLGWEAQVGLEEGVTRLVNWYKREREWVYKVETP